jgi:Lon protease-like protein
MSESEQSEPVPVCTMIRSLPLFPLPGTVFFPGTLLPLHVFEPRYRQMTEAVLSGDQRMGIVLIKGAGEEIHNVAGLGRVVHHEALPDGRFHILLQGMGRVRLAREIPMEDLLYRRADCQLLRDPEDEDPDLIHQECKTLRTCYAELLQVCPDVRDALSDLPTRIQDPGALADIVCATAIDNPSCRQEALEDLSVVGRLRRASDALAELLLANVSGKNSCVH